MIVKTVNYKGFRICAHVTSAKNRFIWQVSALRKNEFFNTLKEAKDAITKATGQ